MEWENIFANDATDKKTGIQDLQRTSQTQYMGNKQIKKMGRRYEQILFQ